MERMLHVEQSEFKALQEKNKELGQQLTKRSAQYVFELRKNLGTALDMEDQEKALAEILPELIAAQKKGITARQLFGPVSQKATEIINGPEEAPKEELSFWAMWLDNTVIVFVFLAVMTGAMALFDVRGSNYGILSLLLSSVVGGLVFNMMYRLIYRYEKPGADKSKRPKTWKAMLIIIALTFVWMMIFSASIMIPAAINPSLDPMILLVLAAAIYGIRYWIKKKVGYEGTFFQR